MEALLDNFFPQLTINIATFGSDPNPQDVTAGEVESSITLTRSAGTPGMDGLTGYMLKAIWEAIPDYLYLLFKSCMKDGYFPSEWKAARVITLLKYPDKVKTNRIGEYACCQHLVKFSSI